MTTGSEPPDDDAPLASAGGGLDPWRDMPRPAAGAGAAGPSLDDAALASSVDDAPLASSVSEPAPAASTLPMAMPSVSRAELIAAWSALGPTGRLIVGASIGVILIAIVGVIVDAWFSSGTFALILVTAAVAAGVAAWFAARAAASPKPSPIPLETIEYAAGTVAVVLAILRIIEMLFDLDTLERFGGPIGAILTVAMAVAAGAILVGAVRGDPTLRSLAHSDDLGTRIAMAGFALVVIGWALNLSIGVWKINAATNTVALATFGTILVMVQPRWKAVLTEVPLAWVGAAFGVVSLLIAAGLWGDLMDLGRSTVGGFPVVLGISDYGPFLVYVVGVLGVIAGGVMAGLAIRPARPVTPPPTTGDVPASPAGSDVPVPSTDDVPPPPDAVAPPPDDGPAGGAA